MFMKYGIEYDTDRQVIRISICMCKCGLPYTYSHEIPVQDLNYAPRYMVGTYLCLETARAFESAEEFKPALDDAEPRDVLDLAAEINKHFSYLVDFVSDMWVRY
jgi:hypothetical protein